MNLYVLVNKGEKPAPFI